MPTSRDPNDDVNEPQPGQHPLADHIGYMLRRAQLSVFQDFCQSTEVFGLRPAEYSVLVVLEESPGTRMNHLAKLLGIKPANCAILINKLVQMDLVRRERLAEDSRVINLFLTPVGEILLHGVNKKVTEHRDRLRERLGPGGAEQLLDLLARLIEEN
jgi:DNA-binding MarR family transcriptional regulator